MLKNALIIALIVALIYLYYQQQKPNLATSSFSKPDPSWQSFLQTSLNSANLEELKTKLGEKTLAEILAENEDYETEVDTLTRTKNSLEADLLAQSNAFQSRVREKDREVKKLKEDLKALEKVRENLTSEKQQHKGSLERIKLLTEQITSLEKTKQELEIKVKKMPGEFPAEDKPDLAKEHQEQLRKLYTLFDLRAQGLKEIDFEKLYELIEKVSQKADLRKLAQ